MRLNISLCGRSRGYSCLSHFWPPYAVAYLGFPAPGDKVSLGAPTQPVCDSIDAENEQGVKGRRRLSRALYMIVSRFVW